MEIRKGGQTLIGFPALMDLGDAVGIEVFDEPEVAMARHREGLRRLFALQIRDALKYLEKNLPGLMSMATAYMQVGKTDSGFPLHLVVFSASKEFDFSKIHLSKKNIILINNAIHPGESDGVDASMMLLRDIVQNKNQLKKDVFTSNEEGDRIEIIRAGSDNEEGRIIEIMNEEMVMIEVRGVKRPSKSSAPLRGLQ